MAKKKDPVTLGIQIESGLNEELIKCAKREKRTKRAVVELALEEYFRNHTPSKDGGEK